MKILILRNVDIFLFYNQEALEKGGISEKEQSDFSVKRGKP